MKIIFISFILTFIVFVSCNSAKRDHSSIYTRCKILRIDSLNNYYVIYAKTKDSTYKIISEKQVNAACKKIQTNKHYNLNLKSFKSLAPIINGVKMYFPDVDCYYFFEDTHICLEKDKGIYDLHIAENINGLCVD